jgi:hypothetical protein
MESRQTDATAAMPFSLCALALTAAAAAFFAIGDSVGFLTDAAEGLSTMTWLAGWASVAWAVLLGGASVALLIRRLFARQRVSRVEVALVLATLAVIVAVAASHPLMGTGSAVAS